MNIQNVFYQSELALAAYATTEDWATTAVAARL